MIDPRQQALTWLRSTYGGLVELAHPDPVAEDGATWLFGCRAIAQPGYPATPMLAASVVVPKDGSVPFHPAAHDPGGDVADFGRAPAPRTAEEQARKLNSRGCVVAFHSALNGAKSVALPWSPAHEAPGWWELLLRRYFPGAETLQCATWDEVIQAAKERGPGTQGVVWVRRETGGVETSGHLIHVHADDDGQVVFLDGMTGTLARLDAEGVRALVFARTTATGRPLTAEPWQARADDFPAAVVKAETWLRHTYQDPVELVGPGPVDEMPRGWLFACNTEAYLRTGDWTQAMMEAAVVVPKSAAEPFSLSNTYPWQWLEAWNGGREPGDGVLPYPPEPGPAAWWPAILPELGGQLISMTEHADWIAVFDALRAMPVGSRALVWARRVDARGRESVGILLNGFHSSDGPGVIDGSPHPITDLNMVGAFAFRLLRYR